MFWPSSLIISVPDAGMFPRIPGTLVSLIKRSMMARGKPFGKVETRARELSPPSPSVQSWCLCRSSAKRNDRTSLAVRLRARCPAATDVSQTNTLQVWQMHRARCEDVPESIRTGIPPLGSVRHSAMPAPSRNDQDNAIKWLRRN